MRHCVLDPPRLTGLSDSVPMSDTRRRAISRAWARAAQLAGVLLDELSGAMALRRAHAQPPAGPPLRGMQTQPPPHGEERANGHAANGPDPEDIAETAHDVERALKQVSAAPGAAHAPKEAPQGEGPVGALLGSAAAARHPHRVLGWPVRAHGAERGVRKACGA